jgi:tetratricopeptide (TPR) repeat protein
MPVPVARIVLLAAFLISVRLACAQSSAERPSDPETLTPRVPPPVVVVAQPPPLPSPPDAPVPDLGSLPAKPNVADSPVKRFLSKLTPKCLDAVLHTCWSSPPAEPSSLLPKAEREFGKDLEVGDLYFKERNFRGAESRFLDALNYHPEDSVALLKLAQTEDKLGKIDDARDLFQTYLDKFPDNGPTTALAKKALQRYESTSTRRH